MIIKWMAVAARRCSICFFHIIRPLFGGWVPLLYWKSSRETEKEKEKNRSNYSWRLFRYTRIKPFVYNEEEEAGEYTFFCFFNKVGKQQTANCLRTFSARGKEKISLAYI
jgi:hypothetical protein